jgi:hypothetical protein
VIGGGGGGGGGGRQTVSLLAFRFKYQMYLIINLH